MFSISFPLKVLIGIKLSACNFEAVVFSLLFPIG